MNSQEIVDYVMNTPNNTNPIILKQMVESSGSSSISVARDPDSMSREDMISFAKQLKSFWFKEYDDMLFCNGYECRVNENQSADPCDACCDVYLPTTWNLEAYCGSYNYNITAFSIEITEAEYDEIWAAWDAMMGKA